MFYKDLLRFTFASQRGNGLGKPKVTAARRAERIVGGYLFRDQQALRERPLVIDPLRFAAEAGRGGHGEDFVL